MKQIESRKVGPFKADSSYIKLCVKFRFDGYLGLPRTPSSGRFQAEITFDVSTKVGSLSVCVFSKNLWCSFGSYLLFSPAEFQPDIEFEVGK